MREMILDKLSHDITIDGDHIARYHSDDERTRAEIAQQVAQAALCLLKTEQGESFINGDHGCPWFSKIMGTPSNYLDVAKDIIKRKLAGVPGVEKIMAVTIKSDGRNVSGSFKLLCENGGTAEGSF